MSKIFIDTNILVYSLDTADKIKHKRARQVLQKIIEKHVPVISTQIINEFFVVATKKLNAGQNYRGVLLFNPFEKDF